MISENNDYVYDPFIASELATFNPEGFVIPVQWLQTLRTSTDKPYFIAALILSYVIDQHRVIFVTDANGQGVYAKKFSDDKPQRSYKEIAEFFGISKNQVTKACHYLAGEGLIGLDFRTITNEYGYKQNNTLFIDINLEYIRDITKAPML